MADFGISRRLPKGQTTHRTRGAGTKCWKAKETLDEDEDDMPIAYKTSTDIQVVVFFMCEKLMNGNEMNDENLLTNI